MFRRERRLTRAVAAAERAGSAPPGINDLPPRDGDSGKT
jgi:hypothetical protein